MTEYDPATALIVVDVQNDFADPAGSLSVAVPRTDPAAHQRPGGGGARGGRRPWSTPRTGIPQSTPHFAKDGGIWPVHCVADTWGAELHPDLAGRRRDHSQGQQRRGRLLRIHACATRSPAPRSPRRWRPCCASAASQRVVICGLATDYCVNATALDARRLGFETRGADERGGRREPAARGRRTRADGDGGRRGRAGREPSCYVPVAWPATAPGDHVRRRSPPAPARGSAQVRSPVM